MPRLTGGRPRRRDRGAVAVLVTMMMTSGMVFGFGALTVDVGLIYAERAQLQTAADSAAIAVAKVCALRRPECNLDRMLLEGGRFARFNVKKAAVEVTEVCGTVVVNDPEDDRRPIEPCDTFAENLTGCLGSPSTGSEFVEVRVRTDRDGDTSALPPVFAGAVTGTNGVTVGACARASWEKTGTVTGALPIVISDCVARRAIDQYGLQPEPTRSAHHADRRAEITLPFRPIDDPSPAGFGFCRNPGWPRKPGDRPSDATNGFSGEVEGLDSTPCREHFTVGAFHDLPGGGDEEEFWKSCFLVLREVARLRQPMPVAVYRPADSGQAYIDSVRGFVVTGWHRAGWPDWDPEGDDDEPGEPYGRVPLRGTTACAADSCLYGYFTSDPAGGGGAAGPTSIRITG